MYVMGLDIGYSTLVSAGSYTGTKPAIKVEPIGACPEKEAPEHWLADSQSKQGTLVSVAGERYLAGIHPRLINNRRVLHKSYSESMEYQALLSLALHNNGRTVIDRLITGLPVQQSQDKNRCDQVRALIQGEHRPCEEGPTIQVRDVQVVPQPFGALCAAANENREMSNLFQSGVVLVIDPGYYSLDWTVFNAGMLNRDASGGSQNSISRMLEEACGMVLERYGARITPEKVEASIPGNNAVYVNGQAVSLAECLEGADLTIKKSLDEIHQTLRTLQDDVDVVIHTGGGAQFWESAVKKSFPEAAHLKIDDPVTANARGFRYWGTSQ